MLPIGISRFLDHTFLFYVRIFIFWVYLVIANSSLRGPLPPKPRISQFLRRPQFCFSIGCVPVLFLTSPLVPWGFFWLLLIVGLSKNEKHTAYRHLRSSVIRSLASGPSDRLFPPGPTMDVAALSLTSPALVHVKKCPPSSEKAQQRSFPNRLALVRHLWTVTVSIGLRVRVG